MWLDKKNPESVVNCEIDALTINSNVYSFDLMHVHLILLLVVDQ